MRLLLLQSALFALAAAQTPPNSSPTANSTLAVTYGTKKVTPGQQFAQSDVQSIPSFSYTPASAQQLYTLLLLDLSIDTSKLDATKLAPSQLPLAPGLGANRTTRLHFWQAGLTFRTNGTLVNTTTPVAYYAGPSPPAGDIAHNYVFYLFAQQAGFQGPAAGSVFAQNLVNTNSSNRQSFNVQTFAKSQGVGPLVAANYLRVQNNGTATSTTASGTAKATGTTTSGARTTTGAAGTTKAAGAAAGAATGAATGTASGSVAKYTGAAMKLSSHEAIGAIVAGAAIVLAAA